ncbi:hypothetical protein ACFL1R_09165 [Candidatus Latescibacterota bacterium]
MKKPYVMILFSLIFLLLLSCSKDSDTFNQRSSRLTIIYSGNVGGQTSPCGCRIPMGGFARRASVINEIRQKSPNVLVLDSGAMLYKNPYLYPPYDYISRLNARIISEVVNEIGINAINVGNFDLADGTDGLLGFNETYSGVWISANIAWKDSGELLFRPDTVMAVGDLRVGIFGFMAQKSMGIDIFDEDAQVRVLNPVETAKKEVAKLKDQSDIIIALAYMDIENVKELLSEVPEINVVIQSHTRQHSQSSDDNLFQPVMVNNTIIVRCPDGGRVIGELTLDIVDGSTEFAEDMQKVNLRPAAAKEQDTLSDHSLFRNLFIKLNPRVKDDLEIKGKIAIVEERIKAYKDSLGLE